MKVLPFRKKMIPIAIPIIHQKVEEFTLLNGEVVCLQCDYKFSGLFPIGEKNIYCPSCKTNKGAFFHMIEPRHSEMFKCECENSLFYLLGDGSNQCPNCGNIFKVNE